MNLCGGDFNITEPEPLLLEIPDEKFQLTPRRKAASSLPTRRKNGALGPINTAERRTSTEQNYSSRPLSARGRSRTSQSPAATNAGPSLLNPLTRDDLKKSINRQRPTGPPLHTSKSVTGLMKKLETGYDVVSATYSAF